MHAFGALSRIISSFCGDIFCHSGLFYNFLHKILFLFFKIIVFEFWLSFANTLTVWNKIFHTPTVLYQLPDSWVWCGKFIMIIIRCGKRKKLPYFPAHKTHLDFFVRNFRKKKRWMYFNFSNLLEENRIVTYQN